jgi:hypothetical protein
MLCDGAAEGDDKQTRLLTGRDMHPWCPGGTTLLGVAGRVVSLQTPLLFWLTHMSLLLQEAGGSAGASTSRAAAVGQPQVRLLPNSCPLQKEPAALPLLQYQAICRLLCNRILRPPVQQPRSCFMHSW